MLKDLRMTLPESTLDNIHGYFKRTIVHGHLIIYMYNTCVICCVYVYVDDCIVEYIYIPVALILSASTAS